MWVRFKAAGWVYFKPTKPPLSADYPCDVLVLLEQASGTGEAN